MFAALNWHDCLDVAMPRLFRARQLLSRKTTLIRKHALGLAKHLGLSRAHKLHVLQRTE